ncbi:hypothetical protein G7Z17_g2586 [Cylindrodendrum hubeiense]|uniref:Transcriptional regulator n=1 Tax=Cylindrodendrum hubeiense TaxID=595255 RepID=A0A9P5HJE1_9HYPO|nr:hypothetical protein G7Z17_g2586 [Cylindrodendrum hubeiense]
MYIRAAHAEADIRILRRLIHDNPWDESSETELGHLRGHLARQNPQSKAIIDALTSNPALNTLEQEVLVIFSVPTHHYITPKFYVDTKPTTGKVVPTWNYAAAQVYGKAKVFFDSASEETSTFLQKQIQDLTHHSETTIMGYTGADRPTEWTVSDAPERYVDILKKNIVGIEITIERLEGKFKMSQEMKKEDREGVIKGLGDFDSDAAQEVSKIVQHRSDLLSQTPSHK